MARKVSFGMHWEEYGRQTIEIPDDAILKSKDDIIQYIRNIWDEIPIPADGDYISESDDLDEESIEFENDRNDCL